MQNKISKRYSLESVAKAIKDGRLAKGWSQRELSARSGLGQAQISRFENAEVDLQLSSLIELARTLDLDLQLVPRSALPAVTAIVREREDHAHDLALRHAMTRLIHEIGVIELKLPSQPRIIDLKVAAQDLENVVSRLVPEQTSRFVGGLVQRLEVAGTSRSPARLSREITAVQDELRSLRNLAFHGDGLKQLPAYSLDEED